MKVRIAAVLLTAFCSTPMSGCKDKTQAQEIICTEEFRSASLYVPGGPLSECYTIRISNSDTIRYSSNLEGKSGYYTVLNDNYQPKLENQKDTFSFIGKRGNEIVVRQEYVFEADQCHITKISGKSELK